MNRIFLGRLVLGSFIFLSFTGRILAQPAATLNAPSQTWVDTTGNFKVVAEFVRLERNGVVLKKPDGKEVTVPLDKLNAASQKQAVDSARKLASSKPRTPPTAAASSTSTTDTSQPIAIPANLDAKQFIDFVFKHAKDGELIVVWDALPTKYQSDIEKLAKLAGTKIDPGMMQPVAQTHRDIVKLLRTKKAFVLNNAMVKQSIKDPQVTAACYDPLVDLIESYYPADLLDMSQLKNGNLRPLIARYMSNLSEKAKKFQAAIPKNESADIFASVTDWDKFKYEVASTSGNVAQLKIAREGQPEQKVDLVQVDDRWLPKAMVHDWDKNIGMAEQSLQNLTPQELAKAKQSMQMPLMMVGGVLNGLLQAQSQDEFDQAIAGITAMIPQGGGMPFPGMPPPPQ